MPLHRQRAQKYLQKFDFESLFIEELGWDTVDRVMLPFEVDGEYLEVVSLAQKRGFTVFKCITPEIPARPIRVKLDRQLMDYSKSHLLVFGDESKTQQEWLWLKPEIKQGKSKKGKGKSAETVTSTRAVRSHSYKVSQNPETLLQKLEALIVDFKEEGNLTHVDVAQKVKQGFDVERVTKQFFQDFEGLHQTFCLAIEGIDSEGDRRWYASVLLNRLMFIYFLQRRYFLDNQDALYLQHKLQLCQREGRNFYEFLKELFFVGFAEPEYLRDPEIQKRLGKICYLNGGLFLRHTIEQKYAQIQIDDRAFLQVFDLFSRYSWHLDDRPEKDPLEINPDVLGYIFEKYINQKEFGAYYTRPEITEYLCDRTINKLVLDRAKGLGYAFDDLAALFSGLDAALCQALLQDILPTLTLLDPACGSGAFLVAAMKTLIGIYQRVVEESTGFADQSGIAQWLNEAARHPSLEYYIKKRIITDNLYGVDIMEEATEIAKLRLFLALVSSAKTVNDLEPLPNIDFNIMAGNSLIGLIRVDGEGFDRLSQKEKGKGQRGGGVDATQINLLGPTAVQGNLLQGLAASEYQRILEDKNRSIALYKKHAFQQADSELPQETRLLQLRDHIDKLNRESQAKLNQLLLDEFSQRLGIKYEQAQLVGKPQKRLLTIADIDALEPFHWGYHFDRVFARGGFDAIIANPPWEIFKPNAKEFFANHSDLVTKKKMDIKAFEKEQKRLLQDLEIAQAWNEYQSQFPHVSAYFRSSEDYINQISIVNGKKAGTDINLYKLFLERCHHLLRDSGECGIVIPSGIYTDLGTKQLREMLFSQTEVTGLFCFENRKEIFEGVHRSFKFVILSFEKGGKTQDFPVRFMRHDVAELTNFPAPNDIRLGISLIRKLSPDYLSITEFKNEIDIQIAKKMMQFPLIYDSELGWNLELYGEELHMNRGAKFFQTQKTEYPLYEGGMILHFSHCYDEPRYWIEESDLRSDFLEKRRKRTGLNEIPKDLKNDYEAYRIAIRKIARNTDSRTLISCLIPKNCLAGNSLSVHFPFENNSHNYNRLRFTSEELLVLVSFLSSFPADYILRSRMTANLNTFYLYQIPVPRLQKGDTWFDVIVTCAAKLICTTPEFDDLAKEVGLGSHKNGITNEIERGKLRAELDGIIAHLYDLTEAEFTHILSTFPIVPEPVKEAALNAYRELSKK